MRELWAVVGGGVFLAACAGGGAPDAGLAPPADAGTTDGGPSDAGAPSLAGLVLFPGPDLDPAAHLFDTRHGLGSEVLDASRDAAGNLWAVTSSRLHVLRAGQGAFESFGTDAGLKGDPLLSVSGGTGGVAWLGYLGEGDDTDDPPWMRESGGVQQVELDGAELRSTRYVLGSRPGAFAAYPGGRYKLRSCWRVYGVKSGPQAGEAWFGCNHGVAMFGPLGIEEHHHPGSCVATGAPTCSLRTGDVPAVAFTADGDRWFGGTYGVMKLDYDQGGGRLQFWGAEPVRNEKLFDAPLAPNRFGSVDISGLALARDDSLWAGSRHSGLARRRSDGSVTVLQQKDGLPSNRIEDLAMDAEDGLWLAFADQGLWRLDVNTGELRRAPGLPSSLARRVVFEETALGPAVVAVVRGGVAVFPR
jgi:hypothetical protein